MKYIAFSKAPEGFLSKLEVAGCYCKSDNRVLLVKRHPEKSQGNTWGVPGGKLEKGETPREAVIREIKEEVGLDIDDESLMAIGTFYCRLPSVDYTYHIFYKSFKTLPKVQLELTEHVDAKWVTHEESSRLHLISGGQEVLEYCEKFSKNY